MLKMYTALSGGLDSSAMALALYNCNIKNKAFTSENFGDDGKYTDIVCNDLDNIELNKITLGYKSDHLVNIKHLSNSIGLPMQFMESHLVHINFLKKFLIVMEEI